jgi:vanillate O-demethylase monooxygenase subunit
MFRRSDASVAALEDACWHRLLPLSKGRLHDDQITCGYHGLVFDGAGRCTHMPSQETLNPAACVRAFPVVEKHRFVWLWPGDPALADPAKVPDLHWNDDPLWAGDGKLITVNCDYRLVLDNLMDLTHETYVHASSIGQKEIDEIAPVTTVEGDNVVTSRHMQNIMAPPFWRMALRGNGLADDVPVDRWQICRFSPPSHVLIEVGVAHAGKGGYHAAATDKAASIVVDFITPETETSIWYFWGMARSFKPDDQELTASIREGQGKIFSEDLEMLEQQQANLLAHPERQLLKLNIDAGGVQSRRILERLIAQERAPVATPELIASN